jgi:hypothetical protein
MKMSRVEAAMRIVMKYHEAFNQHNIERMMQLLSDDCILESNDPAPDGMKYSGKENLKTKIADLFEKLPNTQIIIEEIYGFGLRCVMCWRCEWIDPTGIKQHSRGVDLFQIKNGFICEKRSYVKG